MSLSVPTITFVADAGARIANITDHAGNFIAARAGKDDYVCLMNVSFDQQACLFRSCRHTHGFFDHPDIDDCHCYCDHLQHEWHEPRPRQFGGAHVSFSLHCHRIHPGLETRAVRSATHGLNRESWHEAGRSYLGMRRTGMRDSADAAGEASAGRFEWVLPGTCHGGERVGSAQSGECYPVSLRGSFT